MAAFLFTWPDGDTSQRPIKLPKIGGAAQAVLDRPESGPIFGPDGLKIPLASADPKRVSAILTCFPTSVLLFRGGHKDDWLAKGVDRQPPV
jgi:hypothetical protein